MVIYLSGKTIFADLTTSNGQPSIIPENRNTTQSLKDSYRELGPPIHFNLRDRSSVCLVAIHTHRLHSPALQIRRRGPGRECLRYKSHSLLFLIITRPSQSIPLAGASTTSSAGQRSAIRSLPWQFRMATLFPASACKSVGNISECTVAVDICRDSRAPPDHHARDPHLNLGHASCVLEYTIFSHRFTMIAGNYHNVLFQIEGLKRLHQFALQKQQRVPVS